MYDLAPYKKNICNLMDYPINIDTISMGLPSVFLKWPQVEFSKL